MIQKFEKKKQNKTNEKSNFSFQPISHEIHDDPFSFILPFYRSYSMHCNQAMDDQTHEFGDFSMHDYSTTLLMNIKVETF